VFYALCPLRRRHAGHGATQASHREVERRGRECRAGEARAPGSGHSAGSGAADGVPGAVRQSFAGAAGGARDAGLPRRRAPGPAHPAAAVAQAHPGSAARDIAAAAPAAPAAQAARPEATPPGQAGAGEWSAGSAPGDLVRRHHGVGADPLLSLRRAATAPTPLPYNRAVMGAGTSAGTPAGRAAGAPAGPGAPGPDGGAARPALGDGAVSALRPRRPWHVPIVPIT